MSQNTRAGTAIGREVRASRSSFPLASVVLECRSVAPAEIASLMISPTMSTELVDHFSSMTPTLGSLPLLDFEDVFLALQC